MPSSKEIVLVKDGGSYPDKVMHEGDSLGIGTQTHSFYWKKEGPQNHDYEPLAILSAERCGLSRYHYRGLVVWKDYTVKNGKPIASFARVWHTPVLCSAHKITYSQPSDVIDRLKLIGYLLPKIRQMSKNTDKYSARGYAEKIVDDRIPPERKLRWSDFDYYVMIAPFCDYGKLPAKIPDKINKFVM